jgi:hypothetical protein
MRKIDEVIAHINKTTGIDISINLAIGFLHKEWKASGGDT